MDTNQIVKTLNLFVEGHNKSIIIDGKWGIGKTYKINQFLKQFYSVFDEKKYRVHYVSLFGKKSIEEIHTEVYSKLHPNIDLVTKSIKFVSPATKFIPGSVDITDSLDYILGVVDDNSKALIGSEINVEKGPINSIKRKIRKIHRLKQQHILIFDDLERKSSELSFDELEGYYNTLFLNGLKIVSVCNMEKFRDNDKESFDSFKEKVFDRIYSLTSSDENIMKNYFDFDDVILSNEMLELYNKNLRLAEKTSIFYKEVLSILKSNKIKVDNKENLLWYCSLVVIAINGNQIPPLSDEKKEKYDLFLSDKDDNEHINKITSIFSYDNDKESSYRVSDNFTFIEAVYNFYLFNDDNQLRSYYGVSNGMKYKKSLYLLTIPNRKTTIEKELNQLLHRRINRPLDTSNFRRIEEIFSYVSLFPSWFSMADLENNIAKLSSVKFDALKEAYDMINYPSTNPSYKSFILNVYQKCRIIIIDKTIKSVEMAIKNKKIKKVREYINLFQTNGLFRPNNVIDQKIINAFSISNFYIPDFKLNVDEEKWEIFVCLLHFYKDNISMCNMVKNILNQMETGSVDLSEKEKLNNILTFLK